MVRFFNRILENSPKPRSRRHRSWTELDPAWITLKPYCETSTPDSWWIQYPSGCTSPSQPIEPTDQRTCWDYSGATDSTKAFSCITMTQPYKSLHISWTLPDPERSTTQARRGAANQGGVFITISPSHDFNSSLEDAPWPLIRAR